MTMHQTTLWSIDPAADWIVEDRGEYVSVIPPTRDAELRFTTFSPGPHQPSAEQWVVTAAGANRKIGRPVSPARYGVFSGYRTEFEALGKWLRGWMLQAGSFPLDVTYRCPAAVARRDDVQIEEMLESLQYLGAAV